jgi:hypothetical protein
MSRVLIPDEAIWFDELKAVGYYGESELEREIRQHVTSRCIGLAPKGLKNMKSYCDWNQDSQAFPWLERSHTFFVQQDC